MSELPKTVQMSPLGEVEPSETEEQVTETILEAIQREAHYCRGRADALLEVADQLKKDADGSGNTTIED